jgi:hypothetical protein
MQLKAAGSRGFRVLRVVSSSQFDVKGCEPGAARRGSFVKATKSSRNLFAKPARCISYPYARRKIRHE